MKILVTAASAWMVTRRIWDECAAFEKRASSRPENNLLQPGQNRHVAIKVNTQGSGLMARD